MCTRLYVFVFERTLCLDAHGEKLGHCHTPTNTETDVSDGVTCASAYVELRHSQQQSAHVIVLSTVFFSRFECWGTMRALNGVPDDMEVVMYSRT